MTSVFLTAGATNALTALRSANRDSESAQSAIATGRTINTAADNAAVWAVSKDVESQMSGFTALADSLALGKATVAVGRAGAEKVVDLLSDIQTQVLSASDTGADTAKIQAAIDELVNQVGSVVGAAQFNGENLLKNTDSGGSSSISVLSSIPGDGGAASSITVGRQDLQSDAFVMGATAASSVTDYFNTASATAAAGGSATITIAASTVEYGASYQVNLDGDGAHAFSAAPVAFEYVAREGDTRADVAEALSREINDYITANGLSGSVSVSVDTSAGAITITNADTDAADIINVSNAAFTGGSAGGALAGLDSLDVSTAEGRAAAEAKISSLIDVATNAAAALGSSESRINDQLEFLSDLNAISAQALNALVGADLEAESSRLKAAEAQRALALEALSIANAQADRILTLFD